MPVLKSQPQQHVRTRIAMVLSNPCFEMALSGRLLNFAFLPSLRQGNVKLCRQVN